MPQPKTIELRWPELGVRRSDNYERTYSATGYPSPWSMNCRLQDSLTSRLRGGSFTAPAASTVDATRYVSLVTEAEDPIVTEALDPIVLGPEYGVATGHGRVWVSPGGDAPTSSTADCLYRARLFRVDENKILISRLGDVSDWDYGADFEDSARATIIQLSEAGETGEDVVALVPHKDSYLLCFTANETWVLSGDPVTGTLRNVSRECGIIAARAWAKDHDTVYFLSSHGLYSVGADGSGLKSLSEDIIPEELTDVVDANCVMDYQHSDRGIYIHLTTSPSWFYDIDRQQFWPFDTTETDSHVLIGPLRIGTVNQFGLIQTIHGIMASGSETVTWRIVSGMTAEEAADNGKAAITASLAGDDFDEYVDAEGEWEEGRSHTAYPRVRAHWAVVWLSSTAAWGFESVILEVVPQFGRVRF